MQRRNMCAILVALVVVAEAAGQQQAEEEIQLKSPEQKVAFLRKQFEAEVVPQPIREELKTAIRIHLTEGGPAPLGGELFFSERGLAVNLIAERTPDEHRQHSRALAGVRQLRAGRASDAQLLIAYGEKMLELLKDSYDLPTSHSQFAESNQRQRDSMITVTGEAIKLIGLAPKLPQKSVASMANIYEASVLGTAHPTYKLLPSRRLTFRGDRCGLLLVKFQVFDPSDEALDELRKATNLPVVILDISNGYGRIRLDDNGLIVLGKGKLKDLFPAE